MATFTPNVNRKITSEVFTAYSQCPRKAFLLLFAEEQGALPEYIQILQQKKSDCQNQYISMLQQNYDVQPYSIDNLKNGNKILANGLLKFEQLEAYCGILTRV
jgi:hypothetical protein